MHHEFNFCNSSTLCQLSGIASFTKSKSSALLQPRSLYLPLHSMSTLNHRWVTCDEDGYCRQNSTGIIVIIIVLIVLKICFWAALCTWLARRRRRRARVTYTGGYSNQSDHINMPAQNHYTPQGPPPPAPVYGGRQMSPERKVGHGQIV